jgi:membrane protease YdiL (CAAX protease family)
LRETAWGVASSAGALVLTLLFLWRERRRAADIGLRTDSGSVPRFAIGLAIGFSMYALHALVITTLGGVRLTRTADVDPKAVAIAICTYLALSCMEELGFRGYPLRTLVPEVGMWKAQAIVAAAFAANHLAFGWSWVSVIVGVATGGLLFGMTAIASRGLAMPIGLHAAWNIGSWSAGEKNNSGIWRMAVDEDVLSRAAAVGAASYVVIFALATFAFWRWWRSR